MTKGQNILRLRMIKLKHPPLRRQRRGSIQEV